MNDNNLLKFQFGNSKLDKGIAIFSLPAGHSCPFAKLCLAKANRQTGKLTTGPDAEFRCYAASMENYRHGVRAAHWHNMDLLKKCKTTAEMVDLILASLPKYSLYVRLHSSGDFYNQMYFDAWAEVARIEWRRVFYGYTKSLRYWVARQNTLPGNLILTASQGGADDHLIDLHGLRSARVVYSDQEAADLGLEIDHDDSHAMKPGPDFALLIHGMQPAGSEAAKAVASLKKQGWYGYGKGKKAA